ncbi:AAA family ATPase [Cellulophaga sp. Z1A5H]|uniref:AAA family ATPase n=1 Tax=Cellulophaga sp. Z1A5H TaxID=2687291 RepID=UPI0013FD944A|nr:AAA family ATPase [Cellulophaga sp. Z1A5H]
MNIFFGKISGKFDTNQIEEGYYKSDQGSSWFGSIKIGDYAFIIGGDKIQLWKAREWGEKDNVECLWFDILNDNLEIKLNKFTSLKFFKITKNLVVLSSRSARNKAFFKLEMLTDLGIDYLSNTQTYKDDSLYRKIVVHKDKSFVNEKSQDLQFYYENNQFCFFPNDFTDSKIISNYRDNLSFGGNGAVRKDNVIAALKSKQLNPSAHFLNNEISMRSIYDTLFCEYNSKNTTSVEEVVLENPSSDINLEGSIIIINVLNKILFGPPGTGKTYNTINEALKIVDPEFHEEHKDDRKALNTRFKEYLIKKWDEPKGQIAFCTFHQSFSYEDFVEGIKPKINDNNDVYYKVENGVFKNICELADSNLSTIKIKKEEKLSWDEEEFKRASFYKLSLGNSQFPEDREIYEYCRDNSYVAIGFGHGLDYSGLSENEIRELCLETEQSDTDAQQINYFIHYLKKGNYVLISNGNHYVRALGKISGDYEFNANSPIRYNQFRKVEWIFIDENIPIEEIYSVGLSQRTIYKIDENKLKPEFFVKKGQSDYIENEQEKKYVLIIDEINRGNVSSIFGELITLIEPDKRAGKHEELEVILPYSKSPFKVPHNIHIIGTMNTADKSIEALDTALRRRFSFTEMPPKSKLIETESLSGQVNGIVEEINLRDLLNTINKRIEKLIDKDHKIGHSYFLKVNDKASLIHCFKNEVIPLLEEYFFGDYGKIGLVLGNSFITKDETDDFEFAVFDGYDADVASDLKERSVYKIAKSKDWNFNTI